MKQFRYNLETVLRYKGQELDDLKVQHSVIREKVNRQQKAVNSLNRKLTQYEKKFDEVKALGGAIEDYRLHAMCIARAEETLEHEKEVLQNLRQKEQRKKEAVIEAKVDTSKFEKLKDRRRQEYRKACIKEEERFTEEFIIRSLQDRYR